MSLTEEDRLDHEENMKRIKDKKTEPIDPTILIQAATSGCWLLCFGLFLLLASVAFSIVWYSFTR